MSSSSPLSPSHVGSSESQVHVLDYCSQKHIISEPQKQLKTPKAKNIQLHTLSPIRSDRVRYVRFYISSPSNSPRFGFPSTHTDTYRNDHGYHYPGAGSPEKPPTRQACHSFETKSPPQSFTPSPITRYAPDAPVRPQGNTKPRLDALTCANFVPRSTSPSPLSLRALLKNGTISYSPLAVRQALAPLQPGPHVRVLFPQRQASLASTPSPIQIRATHSPVPSESWSQVSTAPSPLVSQSMPFTLCPQDPEARFHDWVASLKRREATLTHWIDSCHSPAACDPAVRSPSASSVADSWTARSTSIATLSSGSPLAYRVPIVEGQCNGFLSALVGKRIWRFSSADKEAYLNTLDRDDPQRLLQSPPSRLTSIHSWMADIPSPHTPLRAQPSRLRDLSPTPSSLFSSPSSPLGGPTGLVSQALGRLATTPPRDSPCSQASSDCWPFNSRSAPRRPSPASSSGTPLSAASPSASPSPVSPSASPSPVVRSSPVPLASPLAIAKQPSPITLRSLPAVALSSPPVARCSKRKLPADASPAPVRSRPAPVRFEVPAVPTVSRFCPALPEDLPSFPPPGPSMPGSFPTSLHIEPTAPATPSAPASGFPWKTVAGLAVGAFALGCLATRYLF